jgi:N-methylhydantoinase B
VLEIIAPEDTVVSAKWPVAVTGFLMPFEKIMNATYEMWSKIMPQRAISCTFNIEYLLTGGTDTRDKKKPIFMFYDWLPGGWGGRNGRDGTNLMNACFGTGMLSQPVEGQERGNPILTTEFEAITDSGGPGKWRGGVGARKTSLLREAENTVISYICDRERAVVWGTNGGLPSMPHGLHIRRAGANQDTWLGSVFSDVPLQSGDLFSRPTAGGGGYGDPLERDPEKVRADVADDYVSIERAATDYGVVLKVVDIDLCEYEVDHAATQKARTEIRAQRKGWLAEAPESVAARFRSGEIDALDAVRRYAVILDWGTGELLPKSTEQFRELFTKRSANHWT